MEQFLNTGEWREREVSQAFRAVIVYQDSVTLDWATELWSPVSGLIGKESIDLRTWKVDDLTHPRVLPASVQAATLADMILVSLRMTNELPLALYVWIDAWLPRRGNNSGAIVALLANCEVSGNPPAHAEKYLKAVAARAGMEFLFREKRLPYDIPGSQFRRDLRQRAEVVTPVLGGILNHTGSYQHWGLNE